MKRIMFLESIVNDQLKKYALCVEIRALIITVSVYKSLRHKPGNKIQKYIIAAGRLHRQFPGKE
jgi:hypothetical protein